VAQDLECLLNKLSSNPSTAKKRGGGVKKKRKKKQNRSGADKIVETDNELMSSLYYSGIFYNKELKGQAINIYEIHALYSLLC
jgi:hypothetical protein